jgi:hypothetical protein
MRINNLSRPPQAKIPIPIEPGRCGSEQCINGFDCLLWHDSGSPVDDATTDRDLRVPPSNHFEKLRGKLAECIRVNSQWRFGPTAGRCPGRPRASILTTIGTDEANWGIGMRRRSVPCPYQLGS